MNQTQAIEQKPISIIKTFFKISIVIFIINVFFTFITHVISIFYYGMNITFAGFLFSWITYLINPVNIIQYINILFIPLEVLSYCFYSLLRWSGMLYYSFDLSIIFQALNIMDSRVLYNAFIEPCYTGITTTDYFYYGGYYDDYYYSGIPLFSHFNILKIFSLLISCILWILGPAINFGMAYFYKRYKTK